MKKNNERQRLKVRKLANKKAQRTSQGLKSWKVRKLENKKAQRAGKATVATLATLEMNSLWGSSRFPWVSVSSQPSVGLSGRQKVGERKNRGKKRGGQGEVFAGGALRREEPRKKGRRVSGRGSARREQVCAAQGRSSRSQGKKRAKETRRRMEWRRRNLTASGEKKRGDQRKQMLRLQRKKEKGRVRLQRKKKGRPVRGQRTETNGKTARRRNSRQIK